MRSKAAGQRTALYRFFDQRGQLLYVGITDNLGQRWSAHMREKVWWPQVHKQNSEWLPSREAAEAAEKQAIKTERPLYNIAHALPEGSRSASRFVILAIHSGPSRRLPAKPGLDGVDLAEARDLIDDIEAVMGNERIRLAELPARLRALAPDCDAYEDLNGVRLSQILKQCGIRVTNAQNVLRLDPRDLAAARTRL